MINLYVSAVMAVLGLIFVGFADYAVRKLESNLVIIFALMNIDMAVFAFGYAWELSLKSLDYAYMAIKFQYFGLAVLSIYWVTIAYKFKTNSYPSLQGYLYLTIIPTITLYVVATNETHHLFYSSMKLEVTENFRYIHTEKALFYYIFILYTYIVLIYLLGSLYKSYKLNKYNLKTQNKLMLLGSIMPILCNLLYIFGLTPNHFDPTPFGFLLMSFYCYRAVFKYSFLDLKETIRGLAFESVSEGVFVLDKEFRIVDFNSPAKELLPCLTDENIGNYIRDYSLGNIIEKKGNDSSFELSVEKEKKIYVYSFQKSPIIDKHKLVAYIYIFADITETKETLVDLSYMVSHDFLTGIHNRMSFLAESEKELARLERYGGKFSLVMIDIDFFKKVNDTYGHIVGDEVLKRLTSIISKNLRNTDVFGRLGGEEFCILLPETSLENAGIFAEKIRKIVEIVPFYSDKCKFNITISLGISFYSNDMKRTAFEEILDLADKALYTSKNNGRNQTNYMNFLIKAEKEVHL